MSRAKYEKEILTICNKKHLSPADVLLALQKKSPDVGQATVYRTIKTLCENGELKKVDGVCDSALYETNVGEHGHLIKNERVKDFEISGHLRELIEKEVGGKIKGVDLKVYV